MFARAFCPVLFAAVAVVTVPQAVAADETNDSPEQVVERIRESVAENWDKLSKWCRQTVDLHTELPSLPESAWFSTDQKSQRKKIREKLMDIRKLLLSTDAQRIMRRIDSIDERLADIDENLRGQNEQRVLYPEKREKIDAEMARLRKTRGELMQQREAAARVVLKELDALGLRLSGAAAEQCLFTVNVGDLIDNVIVAKNIGLVDRVMVEVQKICFDDYLEKSRDGEWRMKLRQIEADATAARQRALDSARDASFNEHQRAVFRRNAEVNVSTLKAVAAYVKILDQHEAIIQAKADEAAKMLLVAENSYETVSLAGDFLALVKSSQDSFDALLQLQLPPIEIFNDAALQTEFTALTKKLKE